MLRYKFDGLNFNGYKIIVYKYILSSFFLISILSCNYTKENCTNIYLIRHAEKIRSDKNEKDPLLNKTGLLRAQKWSEIFEKIEIEKILSTNTKRTISTVIPTSRDKEIEIEIYSPDKIDYESFLKENKGRKVLIVGHSNTIPETTNKLIKNNFYSDIEDNNNSNLYYINMCKGIISHELLYYPIERQVNND